MHDANDLAKRMANSMVIAAGGHGPFGTKMGTISSLMRRLMRRNKPCAKRSNNRSAR